MEKQTIKHGKEYCCKRWRMLTYLIERGFTPIKTIPDVMRTDYKNWIFENSPEFEAAVSEYFEEIGK